jgi:hypothetical protein
MIFNKGDKIIFDGHKRECICADEDTAVFATFTPHYHKLEGKDKFEKDDNVICYDNMFAVSNLDEHKDLINFEFVGGKLNG